MSVSAVATSPSTSMTGLVVRWVMPGCFNSLPGVRPLPSRRRAAEHGAQGVATGEDGSRELQHAVLLEELGERRAILIVDVAHRPLDDLPDLELVDREGRRRRWSSCALRSGTCAARHVTERDPAVERLLPRHAQDPFAEHVARHLIGATGDAADLPHEEVDAAVGERPTVVEPGSPGGSGELEHDGPQPLRSMPWKSRPIDAAWSDSAPARDAVRDALVEVAADRLQRLELSHEIADSRVVEPAGGPGDSTMPLSAPPYSRRPTGRVT